MHIDQLSVGWKCAYTKHYSPYIIGKLKYKISLYAENLQGLRY